jgi:predicted nucleotide-binding protein
VKVHIESELHRKTVEFESEPRTGQSVVPILKDMLDKSSFAILILTGEDETADGSRRARQNVIHEAGLFQGKLGFEKAVILKQEGVQDLSNLAGLQYIEFSGDNIEQTFYELQRVLRREGVIE